jgi:branched-subunit amino acid transport protein
MDVRDAWLVVLLAGAVVQALRWLPVLLLRWCGDNLPASLTRVLDGAGVATIGGFLGLAVFRLSPAGTAEAAGKLVALALAFVLYLWLRRGTLCLVLAYGAYVLLTLAMR